MNTDLKNIQSKATLYVASGIAMNEGHQPNTPVLVRSPEGDELVASTVGGIIATAARNNLNVDQSDTFTDIVQRVAGYRDVEVEVLFNTPGADLRLGQYLYTATQDHVTPWTEALADFFETYSEKFKEGVPMHLSAASYYLASIFEGAKLSPKHVGVVLDKDGELAVAAYLGQVFGALALLPEEDLEQTVGTLRSAAFGEYESDDDPERVAKVNAKAALALVAEIVHPNTIVPHVIIENASEEETAEYLDNAIKFYDDEEAPNVPVIKNDEAVRDALSAGRNAVNLDAGTPVERPNDDDDGSINLGNVDLVGRDANGADLGVAPAVIPEKPIASKETVKRFADSFDGLIKGMGLSGDEVFFLPLADRRKDAVYSLLIPVSVAFGTASHLLDDELLNELSDDIERANDDKARKLVVFRIISLNALATGGDIERSLRENVKSPVHAAQMVSSLQVLSADQVREKFGDEVKNGPTLH